MPIRGQDEALELRELLLEGADALQADWFDAHTHVGAHDPDGVTGTAAELVQGLDDSGHRRALVFPTQEPSGYGPANDAVRADAEASGGRLAWLCRVAPGTPGAVTEAERCLDLGAGGIKLHPRSDGFGLPHPVVDELVALAGARRRVVLVHAGRGIPALGPSMAALARRNPEARVVLAHAGISDLGLLGSAAAEVPNLLFDTSWWQVADLLHLMTSVPPGRVVYASDMPYGPGLFAQFAFRRTTAAAGWTPGQVRVAAGEQIARALGGEELLDMGPAVGSASLGARDPRLERIVSHAGAAVQVAFRGGPPEEAVALARLGCQHEPGDPQAPLLEQADDLLRHAQVARIAAGGTGLAGTQAVLCAHLLAGTPTASAPAEAV